MRVIAVLFGPALLAVALMEGMARFAPPTEVSVEQPALVWSGRVFTSEEQFARWLASRGGSYERWQARHPESPWRGPAVIAKSEGSVDRIRPFGLAIVVGALTAAAALALVWGVRRHPGAGRRMTGRVARSGRRAASTAVLLGAELATAVLRGAHSLTRVLGAGVTASWRAASRAAAHGVRLVEVAAPAFGRRIDAALAYVLVVFRAGDLRLAGATRSAGQLSHRVDRITVARAARAAFAFGAIAAVSGALGLTIAIVLQ